MKQYHFVTTWQIEAPIERVFEALADSETWPAWWHGVTRVQHVADGDPDGVGNVRRYTFRSVLPYDLTFDVRSTLVDPPARLFGEASGELVGEGRWFLIPTPRGTSVRYEWDVATSAWWMNLLAPVAGPAFTWNHDAIMRWGEDGLRAHLGLPPRAEPARGRLGRLAAIAGVAAVVLAGLGLRRRGRR
jgi:hypothetical protein